MGREQLRELYGQFLQAGYRFREFHENAEDRTIFLRHDIDFCLSSALEIARIEREMDISATYFFMLSSNFYNLHSQRSRALVEQVKALGHRVSLHFDPTTHADLDKGFELERSIFEGLFAEKLEVVSLHRPRGFLENNDRQLPGVSHTYERKYFRDIAYMSDSSGQFKYGHPLDSEAFQERRPIHLLLHPIWWVTEGSSPSDKLRRWQQAHYEFLNEEASSNCVTYDGIPAHRVSA